jgi:hypothetical protein
MHGRVSRLSRKPKSAGAKAPARVNRHVENPKTPKHLKPRLLPPQQRCENALAILDPSPEQAAKCKAGIMEALDGIRQMEIFEASHRPGQTKKFRNRTAAALRRAEILSVTAMPGIDLSPLRDLRKLMDYKTARLLNFPELSATASAYVLLLGATGRKPGLKENGLWHQLAAVLYGYPKEDGTAFFSLDRLRWFHHRPWNVE